MTASAPVVGVDLGGTNLRVAVWDRASLGEQMRAAQGGAPAALSPRAVRREEVGSQRDPESIVSRLAQMIGDALAEAGLKARDVKVGIGIAGMLRGPAGFMANSPHLQWREVPFGDLMQKRLGGGFSLAVVNDANASIVAEHLLGAGRGAADLLGVFVGTGIGSGIIAAGRLVEGATHTASELGHVKAVSGEDAARCACGLSGCVEAYVGGSYLQRRARDDLASGRARSRAVHLAGGADHVTPGHLDAAASEGDDYALRLFSEVAPHLGLAIANAVTLLNPARVILGGGVMSRTPVFREHVIAAMQVAANPPALRDLAIVTAELGDEAGLVGSALLTGEKLED